MVISLFCKPLQISSVIS